MSASKCSNEPLPAVMQKVFRHPNRTILVPHYFKSGVFVAPGHTLSEPREFMVSAILAMGCVEEQYPLWKRHWE